MSHHTLPRNPNSEQKSNGKINSGNALARGGSNTNTNSYEERTPRSCTERPTRRATCRNNKNLCADTIQGMDWTQGERTYTGQNHDKKSGDSETETRSEEEQSSKHEYCCITKSVSPNGTGTVLASAQRSWCPTKIRSGRRNPCPRASWARPRNEDRAQIVTRQRTTHESKLWRPNLGGTRTPEQRVAKRRIEHTTRCGWTYE
jgi:hypothetical protein